MVVNFIKWLLFAPPKWKPVDDDHIALKILYYLNRAALLGSWIFIALIVLIIVENIQ